MMKLTYPCHMFSLWLSGELDEGNDESSNWSMQQKPYDQSTKEVISEEIEEEERWLIDFIPDEILVAMFTFLPENDLIKSAPLVCKRWNALCHNELIWEQVCKLRNSTYRMCTDQR